MKNNITVPVADASSHKFRQVRLDPPDTEQLKALTPQWNWEGTGTTAAAPWADVAALAFSMNPVVKPEAMNLPWVENGLSPYALQNTLAPALGKVEKSGGPRATQSLLRHDLSKGFAELSMTERTAAKLGNACFQYMGAPSDTESTKPPAWHSCPPPSRRPGRVAPHPPQQTLSPSRRWHPRRPPAPRCQRWRRRRRRLSPGRPESRRRCSCC